MFEELWTALKRRLPRSRDQLRIQFRYVALTKPGRGQLASFVAFNFAVAIALTQAVIWIASVDSREGSVTIVTVAVLALFALIRALPPVQLEMSTDAPHVSHFSVHVDNALLSPSKGVTVVGVSDRVDNLFPARLHPRTVLAQAGLLHRLDNAQLAQAIWRDSARAIGKPLPIGHLAWLDEDRRCLILVFAEVDGDATRTTPAWLLAALDGLWATIRNEGVEELHLPLLGSGFGGAGLPRPALFSLIASSYRFALANGPVCDRVTVHVRPQDYSPEEFVLARAALNAVGFRG